MVTTSPVSRKRCPLCLAILELTYVQAGAVATMRFDQHTPDRCQESTLQRIRVLEEMHIRDAHAIESQSAVISSLGSMLGPFTAIVDAGRRWIGLRLKLNVSQARLQTESEVAAAIRSAIDTIDTIEKRGLT